MATIDTDRITDVLRRYVTDEAELAAVIGGESFQTALSIDSLTMVHMVTDLENEFGIRFEPETIERVFENINTLAAFLGGAPKADDG
jgi:acyl carrier protein